MWLCWSKSESKTQSKINLNFFFYLEIFVLNSNLSYVAPFLTIGDLGMEAFHCFPRENNSLSLFCNIGIEHYFTLICPFWDSLQVVIDFLGASINVIYNWKNRFVISKKVLRLISNCWEDHLCISKIVAGLRQIIATCFL